jgi:hypothetical protein
MTNLGVLLGFLPWIVFAIGASFFGLKIGVLIGLALQIALFIPVARSRTYTTLEAFSLAFFIMLATSLFILSEQDIELLTRWSAALSYGGLAFISWASIALGDPFTRQYARRTVPKDLWTNKLFLSSTMSMALGWGVAFLGGTVVSIIGAILGLRWIFIHGLAWGCIVLAILWQNRIMNETQAKTRQLRKMSEEGRSLDVGR